MNFGAVSAHGGQLGPACGSISGAWRPDTALGFSDASAQTTECALLRANSAQTMECTCYHPSWRTHAHSVCALSPHYRCAITRKPQNAHCLGRPSSRPRQCFCNSCAALAILVVYADQATFSIGHTHIADLHAVMDCLGGFLYLADDVRRHSQRHGSLVPCIGGILLRLSYRPLCHALFALCEMPPFTAALILVDADAVIPPAKRAGLQILVHGSPTSFAMRLEHSGQQ